jgi:signal transduction histidine kinase
VDADLPDLLTRPLSRRRLIALDGLAGAGYLAGLLLLAVDTGRPAVAGVELPARLQPLILAGIALAVAVRRLWPLPVFGVVLALSLGNLLFATVRDSFLAAGFALYLVALTAAGIGRSATRAIGVLSGVCLLGLAVAGVPAGVRDQVGGVLTAAVVLGGAWTVGRAVRERRAYAARSAEQLADRAVTGERLRIARELHDVVAHSMGVIAVKAGVANHVVRIRPEEAHDALRVIETASRDALNEMRHLLGVLRADADDGEPAADLGPVPGLAGLPDLAGRAALAGVRVGLEVRADGLPEGLELTVYRIVQEALTNVVKHAAPARCRVEVVADGGTVRVDVTDDGPGRRLLPGHPDRSGRPDQPGRSGHGLIGMRERVMMYGGAFTAGPAPDGGFAVSARLPYQPVRQEAR